MHFFPHNLDKINHWLKQIGQEFHDLESFAQQIWDGNKTEVYLLCSVHLTSQSCNTQGSRIGLTTQTLSTIFLEKETPSTTEENNIPSPHTRPQLDTLGGHHSTAQATGDPHTNTVCSSALVTVTKDASTSTDPCYRLRNRTPQINSCYRVKNASTNTDFCRSKPVCRIDVGTFMDLQLITKHKCVQWPEYEMNWEGESWKVLHDHMYPIPPVCTQEHTQELDSTAEYCKYRHSETHPDCTESTGDISSLKQEPNDNELKQYEFDEVAVYFSKDEWDCLQEEQKDLYREVMMDNYQMVRLLGLVSEKPSIITHIESGEEPYVWCPLLAEEEETPIDISRVDASLRMNTPEEGNSPPCSPASEMEEVIRTQRVDEQEYSTKKEPWACPECGKFFRHESILHRHKIIHTGERPFKCFECGKCFKWKSGLVNHQMIHTGEWPFTCAECGKCFSSKAHLLQHQVTHTEIKPFECPQCGKCYKQKSTLIVHMRSHTGFRPFVCSECGKRFARSQHLTQHSKRHAKEKSHTCSECGKGLNTSTDLVTKQRYQIGNGLYVCTICGKSLNSRSLLVAHQRTHTDKM